jgi:hypothetical protein
MSDLINFTELQQVLQDYAKDAAEIYKYQISLGGKNASRKLIDSVNSRVIVGDQAYEVSLNLMEYWKYVEGGSKGKESSPPGAVYPAHFPPVGVLINWINVKPILPRPDVNGRIPSPKSLAFLIGRKIENEGIEPFPALETTKEELDKIYHEKLSAALGHDVSNYIRKIIAVK